MRALTFKFYFLPLVICTLALAGSNAVGSAEPPLNGVWGEAVGPGPTQYVAPQPQYVRPAAVPDKPVVRPPDIQVRNRLNFRAYNFRYTGGDRAGLLSSNDLVKFSNPEVKVSELYASFFVTNFPVCVGKAAKQAGFSSPPSTIKVNHMGGYQPRNVAGSNSLSLHAGGRALDISNVDVTFQDGQKKKFWLTKGHTTEKFFTGIASCWQAANASRNNCGGRGRRGHGIVDYRHKHDHHDHMHFSMPFCPNKEPFAGS